MDRFFGDIPEAASVGPPPGLADASGNPAHQGNVDPKDSFCDVPQARLWMQRVSWNETELTNNNMRCLCSKVSANRQFDGLLGCFGTFWHLQTCWICWHILPHVSVPLFPGLWCQRRAQCALGSSQRLSRILAPAVEITRAWWKCLAREGSVHPGIPQVLGWFWCPPEDLAVFAVK